MNEAELREALEKLHLELLKVEDSSPETIEKIATLQKLLRDPETIRNNSEDPASVEQLVRDSITYFEASHPTLTSVLNQLSHLLSSIGI